MKTVAIMGSNGMIGADLVHYLSPYFSITSITKENYSSRKGSSFDVVINTNGNSKRFWANENVLEDFSISTVSVYNTLFDFKFGQYIYISSSDVYPNHSDKDKTSEDQELSVGEMSAYGLHKYLSEILIRARAENYIVLRSSLILGRTLKKGPIFDILNSKPLFVSRETKLQMITGEEVANSIRFLIDSKTKNTTLNIGGIGTVSFEEIEKYFNKTVSFQSDAQKQEYEMSVEKMNKIFPLKKSTEYLVEYIKQINKSE